MSMIKVMADHECDPLWLRDDEIFDNVSPNAPWLGLNDGLVDALNRWAAEYDATLNRDDPIESGFPLSEDETRFVRRGRELAEQLAEEVGTAFSVSYFDILEMQERVIS